MILLWGVPGDPPIAAVEQILRRERVPYAFLDQRAILETELILVAGEQARGALSLRGDTLRLEEVKAVYARPYDLQLIKEVADAGPESAEFHHATAMYEAMAIWLDLTTALVLNRPRAMALNYSKPFQSAMIERAGFAIPETLLTTDPRAVRNFRQRHGTVIYKSVSSMRSMVSQLRPEDEARLESVTWCPTQFQQRITGMEVRAHVIGNEVFACEIVSKADDYRYANLSGDTLEIRACNLPDECAARCRKVAESMNFIIAGVDLRCQDDTWYCFEVNPSPGFMYYQEHSGHRIDEAIAALLVGACRN